MAKKRLIRQLTQAVADTINAADLESTIEFKATRRHAPSYKLEQLNKDGVQVDVVFAAAVPAEGARDRNSYDYFVDIGIQSHVNSVSVEDCDPLTDLAEDIDDALRRVQILKDPNAVCLRCQYKVPFDPAELRERRRFICVLTAVIRVMR